uniref:Uncharacterized protein n=1 Tax=uncultured marine group II/III euryarchaeote KM3_64_C08 TaxID=1456479 RepID=A0A075HBC2_9EURY|nr:hypothetical protein [uncultured marine group II/III euryarchaeote KM3_64_C08]
MRSRPRLAPDSKRTSRCQSGASRSHTSVPAVARAVTLVVAPLSLAELSASAASSIAGASDPEPSRFEESAPTASWMNPSPERIPAHTTPSAAANSSITCWRISQRRPSAEKNGPVSQSVVDASPMGLASAAPRHRLCSRIPSSQSLRVRSGDRTADHPSCPL